jgi:hypothetical protein
MNFITRKKFETFSEKDFFHGFFLHVQNIVDKLTLNLVLCCPFSQLQHCDMIVAK